MFICFYFIQVWKQKGEEYRVHGQWGWIWLSTSRNYKRLDCRKCGLRAGPQRYMVQVRGRWSHICDTWGDVNIVVDVIFTEKNQFFIILILHVNFKNIVCFPCIKNNMNASLDFSSCSLNYQVDVFWKKLCLKHFFRLEDNVMEMPQTFCDYMWIML